MLHFNFHLKPKKKCICISSLWIEREKLSINGVNNVMLCIDFGCFCFLSVVSAMTVFGRLNSGATSSFKWCNQIHCYTIWKRLSADFSAHRIGSHILIASMEIIAAGFSKQKFEWELSLLDIDDENWINLVLIKVNWSKFGLLIGNSSFDYIIFNEYSIII